MGKKIDKKDNMIDIDSFYLEKENRRKKREITKKKKNRDKNLDKWN